MSAYYNEIDPQKAAWLRELIARNLIAPGDVDERSIADVRADDLAKYTQCHFFAGIGIWSYALRLAGWPDDREVWTGSCPCQPFSAAGKGEAFDDERHLWPKWFPLIETRRPIVCFGEQVASIDGLAWLDLVQSDLDDAGYTCGAVDICAAGIGAPHRRQRLYWVADSTSAGLEGSARQIVQGNGHRLASSSSSSSSMADSSEARRTGARQHDSPDRVGERSKTEWLGNTANDGRIERILGNETATKRATSGVEYIEFQNEGRGRNDASNGGDGGGIRGPVNGFWRSANWVLTRPQRVGDRPGLRPVERSAFPLANGTPARVGRLRGYGDGIVAQTAQAFIEAYMNL